MVMLWSGVLRCWVNFEARATWDDDVSTLLVLLGEHPKAGEPEHPVCPQTFSVVVVPGRRHPRAARHPGGPGACR
jgi:hypothetical protein